MAEAGGRKLLIGAALVAVLALYVALAAEYVRCERPNQDEGWYLEAARQVDAGRRPYVDFAYVQPPLLPYVYALFAGHRSLAGGRSVSVLLGALAVLLTGLAARAGGPAGMLVAAGLLALTPFALSQQSIVKTYALANACAALGLAAAGRGLRARWTVAASVGLALAALARNSSAPLLLAHWLWLAVDRRRRAQLLVAVPTALLVIAAGYAPFVAADAEAVRFHLLEHHARNVAGGDPVRLALLAWAVLRLQVAACPMLSLSLLVGGAALAARRRILDAGPESGLAALALIFVAGGQFISAHPYQEYQALALPPAAMLAGLMWGELTRFGRESESWRAAAWAVVLVWPLLALGPALAQLPGARLGAQGVHGPLRELAGQVAARSARDETIFTFQTDVAVEARRPLSPGLTLASFSFADLPADEARRRHLVSPETIRDTFERAEPTIVVLSPGDLANLLHGEWTAAGRLVSDGRGVERYGPVIAALDRNYRLVARVEKVGQFAETMSVLERRR